MAEWVEPAAWLERAQVLKAEGWWLSDLTGLDVLGLGKGFEHRFEVVVQLLHHERKERQTIHVPAVGEPPTVPSVTELWQGAKFPEMEAYDMFGIHFDGHENLGRILMPDEWEGHPLRKDYGVGKVGVQFKPQPFFQIDSPRQGIDAQEGGVEVDHVGQISEPAEPVGGGER